MPSYLDLGVIAVILVSALLAMLRGFTREVLAIASWIAAALAGAYLYPYLLPYVKPYVTKEPWASIASATAIFFVALVVVSIVTVNLSDAILDSKVGALDRSLGFLFGVARGFLLCVIAYVFFSMLDPLDKQPAWMRNAKTRPVLQSVGDDLTAMLPHDLLSKIIKPKATTPGEEVPADGEADDKMTPDKATPATAAPDANSPAPLPVPRDNGGKEP